MLGSASRLLAATAVVLGLLRPAPADAQASSVVIARLDGRNSAAARRVIQSGLEERGLTVTLAGTDPADDVEATARLAQGASAGAVIGGRAAARGRGQWVVELWVRDAMGGPQGEVSMRVRGRRGVSRLVTELAEALELVPTAASPTAEPASSPPEPDEPDTGDAGTEPAARPPSPSDDDEPEAPTVSVWAMVGAGMRSRGIELLSPDGIDAAYRVEPYFEIAARAGARFLDILFVRASFGSSVALDSRREAPSLGNVDTHFYRLRGDVGASYWIDGDIELGGALGLGWDRYDLAFNELVPTAEYVHLRPAVIGGFRLIEQYVVLDAELGLRIPFGVGDLQSLHGVDYRVIGVDGVMRLHGVVDPGFTWAVEATFRHYDLLFRRGRAPNVDGHDAGWRATAYVGWQLDIR